MDSALQVLLTESRNERARNLQTHLPHFDSSEKHQLLRQLLCIRPPNPPLSSSTLHDIDTAISHKRSHRVLTSGASIPPAAYLKQPTSENKISIKLWKGDITSLDADVTAITNAANGQMLGCFQPSHKCIDNVIHSWAGPRLRQECFEVMNERGPELAVGDAIATKGYCLPSPYVIHTVGPQLRPGPAPTKEEQEQLEQCYVSVLEETERLPASSDGSKRVALCGISTGLFSFPAAIAARIAVTTVQTWLTQHENTTITDVIFVTYKDSDHAIYTSQFETLPPDWHSSAPALPPPLPTASGESLSTAHEWLSSASTILVTAGAGLSAADGLDYTSPTLFASHFPTFLPFGFTNLYSVFGFTNWTSNIDRWSYYFTHLSLIRSWPRSPLYTQLINYLKTFGDDVHVRTSNADGLFVANGWDEQLLSTPQGQYAVFQCLENCTPDSYWPSLPFIERALPHLNPKTQRLTSESAIPTCENCGGDMFICVRAASWFNARPFRAGETRWKEFRKRILTSKKNTVILELGAGFNTPGVLRWPNEDLVRQGQGKVKLVRFGLGSQSSVPEDLEEAGLATYVDGDLAVALPKILPKSTAESENVI